MNCPQCNIPATPGSSFCTVCGAKLPAEPTPAPEATTQRPVYAAPEYDAPDYSSPSYAAPDEQPRPEPAPAPDAPRQERPTPPTPPPVHSESYSRRDRSNGAQGQSYSPGYAQYPPQPPANDEPVGIGAWIGVMFLSLVPFVNFVVMIVFACLSTIKPSLRNYARAYLIFLGIIAGVALILVLFGVSCYACTAGDFAYSFFWS